VDEAPDPALREVLLDLAIVQSFRRDLFVRGPCPPSPTWRRNVLSGLGLASCSPEGENPHVFDIALGHFSLDPAFTSTLLAALGDGVRSVGALTQDLGLDLEELLSRLSLLISHGAVGVRIPAATDPDEADGDIERFNRRCLELLIAGEDVGGLLSPVLLQPVPVNPLEAFFLQLADADLPDDDAAQLVWMGITMAGGSVKDPEGRPIEDPQQALAQLRAFGEAFRRGRLPLLRRIGIVPTTPSPAG